ncbi:hypothetical protein AB0383_20345 [Amycolatopsis sp. NPDC051373]|uniref:hypothetical protein n=1 Tax=Amycolatopsis sp. NPDC051373 TaxID=3155801 RepID=UPI0034507735
MSLHDRLTEVPVSTPAHRPRAAAPKGFEPSVKYEGNAPAEVSISLPAIGDDERVWREEIKRVTGLDIPEHREVVLTDSRYWGNPEAPNIYCRFKIVDRDGAADRLDLAEIIRVVTAAKKPKPAKTTTDRALVVALADMQVGKVASRGGTEELLTRLWEKLDALEKHSKQIKADTVYLLDVGDCVESFENVAAQGFTNDLSFPEQLRVARRVFTEFVVRLSKLHPNMVVAGVPSNHGAWRRGKDSLGRPGDDYGVETLVAVADACTLNPDAFAHVAFRVPGIWEETMSFDIHGTILAMAHGHQVNRPNNVPQWWANQVHGGQPAADADILLTGHFHHLRVEPTGRSAHTSKSKWWFQAPTVDNGSEWYRLRAGHDSDPGLLTFTVGSDGWDNLKIL